ncbi:MAG: hypothetical protein HEEMFOPI_01280 [Holosporales bacterium]
MVFPILSLSNLKGFIMENELPTKGVTESGYFNLPEWFSLITTNRDDYARMYINQSNRFSKMSFNWSAAFFSFFWFAYRKMYMESIIFLTIITVFSCFVNYYQEYHMLFILMNFVIFGFLGNGLYFRFLQKKYVTHHKSDIYIDVNKLYKNIAIIAPIAIFFALFSYIVFNFYFNSKDLISLHDKIIIINLISNVLSFVLYSSLSIYFYLKEKKTIKNI